MSYKISGTDNIKVKDKEFSLYLKSDKILEAVKSIADQIYKDYKDENPLFLVVLKGSFIFASDLLKAYEGICEVSFIRLSSYRGMETTEEVKTLIGLSDDIKNRNVIILEDIIDSGITITHLLDDLQQYKPKALKVATLLFKPEAVRTEIDPDYIGFSIPKDFIVGYGLDYDGYGRNLSDIYKIVE